MTLAFYCTLTLAWIGGIFDQHEKATLWALIAIAVAVWRIGEKR
jgi:hypothetical protein